MDADGSDHTRLTNSPGIPNTPNTSIDIHPAFSPDGTKIAFTSFRDGNYEIYLMDADGSNQTNITNSAVHETHPAFSPDGSKIAFSFNLSDIYVMDADGSNPTNLTNDQAPDEVPAFSPDGTKIAFSKCVGFCDQYEIFVMDADGSNQTNITNDDHGDAEPDWGPAATPTLTVSTAGTGTGSVTGPGIDCPGDCEESYAEGTNVSLTATPTGGSIFGGWSGDCSEAGSCDLTMSADRDVSASFYPPLFCRGQAVTIYGTDGDDTIDGTSGADVIAGLGGDDTITGGDDDDLICSAGGEDTVAGGAGADIVRGGGDNDLLAGNAANDILRGLDGDDSMFGGPGGNDLCDGGAGTGDTAGANCEQTPGVP